MSTRCWLFKTEPNVYSISDLLRDGETYWEGVRNYQARNILRDDVKVGDEILFYHSNAKPPGAAGLARVVEAGTPDPYQFESDNRYFDPKSKADNPRWFGVRIEYVSTFEKFVSLPSLQQLPEISDMVLLQRSRLSVQPVTKEQRDVVVARSR